MHLWLPGIRTGWAIAFTDVVEGHQYVNLSDHPFSGVVLAKRQITERNMATAVNVDVTTRTADVEKVLVNGKTIY